METTKNAVKSIETKKTAVNNILELLITKQQKYLYKFQQDKENKLSPVQAKQVRQKIRRIIQNFYLHICLQTNMQIRKEKTAEFLQFYKSTYILNDFSVGSLSESKDPANLESIKLLLAAAQKSMTEKK